MFALDPNFADSQLQKQLLKSYQARSLGKLQVSDPISGVDPFFQALVQAPAAHLYYFYCHGYAPTSKSAFKRDGVKVLKERIEALPKAEQETFETLLNLTAKMNDEPWIFIGDSEIKESIIKTQNL